MPIETTVPESPGWWIARLATKLNGRRERLDTLSRYYRGDPPLPTGAENAHAAYQAFQRKARTNFAELVVEALRERCVIGGFRTAAADDENGDEDAWALWRNAGVPVELADVIETMFSLGDSYVIVGLDPDTRELIVTGEDPRQVVTEHDPRQQRKVLAALKSFHDDVAGFDFLYLYLPGRVFVARREMKKAPPLGARTRFSPQSWDWDTDRGGGEGQALPHPVIPVVRFRNKRGVGEFETHLDVLDRINHMLLQRMVIATMQAFRQRAIKGDLPETDEAGNPINYDELLAADPGALWRLPEAVELWESGQVDLTPILSSVKDDVLHLAAVTRTPLHMFTPDAAAQGSAEGASLQREGLVFKAEDRIERISVAAAQVLALMFMFEGDEARAKVSDIEVLWRPAERFSLAERTASAVQAATAGVPWRTRMSSIMQYTPAEVARMETEKADEDVLAAAQARVQAAALAAAQPAPGPGQAAPAPGARPGAPAPTPPGNAPQNSVGGPGASGARTAP